MIPLLVLALYLGLGIYLTARDYSAQLLAYDGQETLVQQTERFCAACTGLTRCWKHHHVPRVPFLDYWWLVFWPAMVVRNGILRFGQRRLAKARELREVERFLESPE